jgi:hypothetical protein
MKKIYLPLLAALALAGCTQSELSESPVNAGVELKFKSTALAIDGSTRAPFEGEGGTVAIPLEAKVLVKKQADTYQALYNTADDKITFTDGNETGFAITKYYYPADGTGLHICGLYPYAATGTGAGEWNINGTSAEANFTFNGSHDVMAAAQVATTKAQAQASTYPTLAFKHLLTKLVIKVKAEDAAAIAAWGNVTKIDLIKAKGSAPYSKVTVKLVDGTAARTTDFSTVMNPFPFYAVTGGTTYTNTAFTGQTLALTTTSTVAAYSLVAPILADGNSTAGSADFELKVYTDKAPAAGMDVPVGLLNTLSAAYAGETQGKAFEVTLTFKATEIKAKATVSPWVLDGTSSPEIK